jgi:hypothetical protein
MSRATAWIFGCALLGAAARAAADPAAFLDRLDRALAVEARGGLLRAELSGLLDVEGYYIDRRAPGLVFGGGSGLVNPRLRLFLDAQLGRYFYGFVQARFDRGFDPRAAPDGDARADEYLLRWTPLADPRLNLQAGKFATVVGNFVSRHDSWTNPFVTAPLPYENVTVVSDGSAPATVAELLARRHVPDKKDAWVPLLWGPSYASGAAVFGRVGPAEYAAEVKNAALSSRPADWDGSERGWGEPTTSARLGWRPGAPWLLGASCSSGPYLRDEAAASLAPGRHTRDFRQTLFGVDLAWARRHLELWAEGFAGRFEIPVGTGERDADTVAYHVEGRYKLTPALFAALRWNQQLFGEIDDDAGRAQSWDRDVWRVDTALGYRLGRHLQAKVQYAWGRQTGDLQQGEQLVAAQLTVRF